MTWFCTGCGEPNKLEWESCHNCDAAGPLGFVVLARRPGQPPEPVSAVFPAYPNGLEQAQNARAGAESRGVGCDGYCAKDECVCPVEYVIGEISERTP